MPYVPDANDPTEPLNSRPAGSAAEEFRALKTLVAGLVVAASASAAPRQVIVDSQVDSNGYNNAISAGAGLRVGLSASADNPYQLSFATGFSGGKAINSEESLVANVADLTAVDLAASNINFLYRTFGSIWGSCLVPPQYGYSFDRTRGAVLNFEGNNGGVNMDDAFGNTWTPSGNAQLTTAQFKFGTASLLLDGTGDFVQSADFTTLGPDSWEISTWFRVNSTATVHGIFAAINAADFGAIISLQHNAGNRRLQLDLSNNGTSDDIANATVGATATIALNTWYKVRLVFDSLAGNYKVYLSNNGAAESLEMTVASAVKICAITRINIGNAYQGNAAWNGWIDGFRFVRAATNTSTEVPAAAAPAITDYPYHFFSIPKMRMYEATAPAAGAGQNPTLTARTRLFIGEADTDAAAVTAVRNYALRGEFVSALFGTPFTGGAANTHNHNLGIIPRMLRVVLVNVSPSPTASSFTHGEEIFDLGIFDSNSVAINRQHVTWSSRNTGGVATGTGNLSTLTKVGALDAATNSHYKWRMYAQRGW